jgi:uncharacterized CHY-type Zn-finger protein
MIGEKNFNQPPAEKPEEEEKKKFTKVKIICGWCRKEIGEKEVEMASGSDVTHGICDECKANAKEEEAASKRRREQKK